MRLPATLTCVCCLASQLALAASNDNFSNAIRLNGPKDSSTSTYLNAGMEAGEQKIATWAKGQTLWWVWTAPSDGLVGVDLAGTAASLYTVVGVYEGGDFSSLNCIVANRNLSVWGASHCDFIARAGTTYHLVADLYVNETRASDVRISLQLDALPPVASRPSNDDFAHAEALTGTNTSGSVNNVDATGENGEPATNGGAAAKSVWWRWVAQSTGFLQVSTAGSTTTSGAEMDTILAAYSGTSLPLLSDEANSDDSGSRLTSDATIAVQRGLTYYLAVMTSPGSPGGTVQIKLNFLTTVPAPAWTARSLADLPINSTAYAGQVLVINIWATWCGPCRSEIPELVTLHEKYKARGFSVIGVSIDSAANGKSPTALVGDFVATNAITYPVLLDRPWGSIEQGFGFARSIPTSYIIDRQGNIVSKLVGSMVAGYNLQRFEQVVLPLLSQPTGPSIQCVRLANGGFELSWPTNPAVRLEVRSNLSASSMWQPGGISASVRDGRQVVNVQASGQACFFRLVTP